MIGQRVVHVWMLPTRHTRQLESFLDDNERERMSRLRDRRRQLEFAAVHGAVRGILSAYLAMPPRAIRLRRGPWGKPETDGLRFNLSHCSGAALLAVTRCRDVGIDVEGRRLRLDVARFADRFLPGEEGSMISALPPAARQEAFLRLWTRREAVVKAAGGRLVRGLRMSVSADVVVGFSGSWRVYDLDGPAGCAAALAVRGAAPCTIRWPQRPELPEGEQSR
ncbi:4'-phosphopantetheinyl transferase family protein [Nonomuraea insulae]|uniref:4'-phosphopantetheinyl transferase family protein n=1 Tax=Nonomuraea insulae TaxID=1616787 RepID=A0ABW1D934_9ACTN